MADVAPNQGAAPGPAPDSAPDSAPALVRPDHLAPEPRRSTTPRLVGALAILFASLGLLGSVFISVGVESAMLRHSASREILGPLDTWLTIYLALAGLVFAAHLTAGIQGVRYAPSAPRWMTTYAILAIGLIIADSVVSFATVPIDLGYLGRKIDEDVLLPRYVLSGLALPWPILVLVVMNRPSARAACAERRD